MSKLSLRQAHSKSPEEVRGVVDELSGQLREHFGLDCQWRGDNEVVFQRKGVDGVLRIDDAEVKIDMTLGLLMGAFKNRIRDELQRTMEKHLS